MGGQIGVNCPFKWRENVVESEVMVFKWGKETTEKNWTGPGKEEGEGDKSERFAGEKQGGKGRKEAKARERGEPNTGNEKRKRHSSSFSRLARFLFVTLRDHLTPFPIKFYLFLIN